MGSRFIGDDLAELGSLEVDRKTWRHSAGPVINKTYSSIHCNTPLKHCRDSLLPSSLAQPRREHYRGEYIHVTLLDTDLNLDSMSSSSHQKNTIANLLRNTPWHDSVILRPGAGDQRASTRA